MVYKPGGFVLGVWHVSLKERCWTCQWCITCRIDAGHVVCHVVWKPEGLVACPLEFPLPGS